MWNYRIVRKKHNIRNERIEYTYGIHEVFYDKNKKAVACTVDPVSPFGSNIQELRTAWIMQCEAFGQPILNFDQIPEPGHDKNDDLVKPTDKIKTYPYKPPKKTKKHLKEIEEFHKMCENERVIQEVKHAAEFVSVRPFNKLVEKIAEEYFDKLIKEKICHTSSKKTAKNSTKQQKK